MRPGALHVTVAGAGVLHEEHPERPGVLARGYQIWIDLPDEEREILPQARHLAADQVPQRASPQATLRVVLRAADGLASPLDLPTAVSLIDVRLAPGARWVHRLPAGDHAVAFVLDGALYGGAHRATAGQLLCSRPDGDRLSVAAGDHGARFTLLAGTPLQRPRLMHGPFVARDPQQLARFVHAHADGRFGRLASMART